jgi:hypothetical protein
MATRKRGSNTGIPGLSFSWKRATGVTSMKRKIARRTGIPTTRAGRQRKIGRMVTGGCCLTPLLGVIAVAAIALALFISLLA